jgi:hypothetical protein
MKQLFSAGKLSARRNVGPDGDGDNDSAPPEIQIASHFCATMSQFDLKVATRANHAALLPVVLIATSINEARPSSVINITYEDTALLQDGDKAIVQLVAGSKSVFGTTNIIQELTANFPFLTGKDAKVVSFNLPRGSH